MEYTERQLNKLTDARGLRDLQSLHTGEEPIRIIEMYVGISYGGNSGDWYVTEAEVPAWMTRAQAIRAGREKVLAALDSDLVAFVGLYHFPEEEEMTAV